MDLGSLFFILALLILVGLFVSRPFFELRDTADTIGQDAFLEDRTRFEKDDHHVSSLLAGRDRVLDALYELDFDAVMGKIPEDDYPRQREALLKEGAEILRQLKAYQTKSQKAAISIDELLVEVSITEQQVALANAGVSNQANGRKVTILEDDEIETLLANRRRMRQGKASGFCHKCGGALQKVDKFCPKCGAKV
jgi:hypothetical protein